VELLLSELSSLVVCVPGISIENSSRLEIVFPNRKEKSMQTAFLSVLIVGIFAFASLRVSRTLGVCFIALVALILMFLLVHRG
jgi:hypothetical protein